MLKRTLKVATYVIVGLLIGAITVILVAYGKGASYDFKNRRFVYSGLVLLESLPDNARVTVNGELASQETPYRVRLEAGSYDFGVTKEGFRNWSKTIEVVASEVSFAQYVVLFPSAIKSERVSLGRRAYGLTASSDGKQFSYLTSGRGAGVWLFNPESRQARRIYQARSAKGRVEKLVSVDWAEDGSRLLLKSVRGGQTHYTAVTTGRTPDAEDLTDLFNQDFRELKFNPANSSELYWLSPQSNLHRLDLGNRTASAVLARRVSGFDFGGGRVFYVQTTKLGRSLFSLERSGIKQELIQSVARSSSYEIAHIHRGEQDFLAVVPSGAKTATLYQDIFTPHLTAKVIGRNVNHVKRSPDGRFLVFYNSSSVVTYDLEKKRHYDFAIGFKSIENLEWFDEFHLLLMADGQPQVVEFDGANLTKLAKNLRGAAFAQADREAIVGLGGKADSADIVFQLLR